MARNLDVYLHDRLAGRLTQDDSGQLAFAYDASWLARPDAMAISQSLPLQAESFDHRTTRPFFAGLLPDAEKRERLARVLGVSERNDFSLLDRVGGDCAGALALWPGGSAPPARSAPTDSRTLSPDELADILRSLPDRPLLAGQKGIRLSLAGAQDKLPVRVDGDSIVLPLHGSPSTHIVKPGVAGLEGVVLNEAFCLCLAERLGLPAAKAQIRQASDVPFLLIQRYDRMNRPDGTWMRLHQEDFCQALACPPELKYENEGGPSLGACFALVRRATARPALDLIRLLDAVIFQVLTGNRDAHGKNYSILYGSNGPRLAPLYDVTSTVIYPQLDERMAMKIGGQYGFDDIYPRHWARLAKAADLNYPLVRKRILSLTERMPAAARTTADALRSEGHDAPVVGRIVSAIENAAATLEDRFRRE